MPSDCQKVSERPSRRRSTPLPGCEQRERERERERKRKKTQRSRLIKKKGEKLVEEKKRKKRTT